VLLAANFTNEAKKYNKINCIQDCTNKEEEEENYIIVRQKAVRLSLPHLKTVQFRQRQFIYRSDHIRSIGPLRKEKG
jgi:hypothetical protein